MKYLYAPFLFVILSFVSCTDDAPVLEGTGIIGIRNHDPFTVTSGVYWLVFQTPTCNSKALALPQDTFARTVETVPEAMGIDFGLLHVHHKIRVINVTKFFLVQDRETLNGVKNKNSTCMGNEVGSDDFFQIFYKEDHEYAQVDDVFGYKIIN